MTTLTRECEEACRGTNRRDDVYRLCGGVAAGGLPSVRLRLSAQRLTARAEATRREVCATGTSALSVK